MSGEPLVLTVDETAELLRISRGSAYEAVRTGDIPSVRVGRRILIPHQLLLEGITAKGTHNERPTGQG